MKTTTINLTGPEALGAASRRKDFAAISGRLIRRNSLPAEAPCSVGSAMAGSGSAADMAGLTVGKNSAFTCTALPDPAQLWRSALLPEAGKEAFAEKCLYSVLTATVVSSLLMAFWQLRSLEAGWASFVELVSRIVS